MSICGWQLRTYFCTKKGVSAANTEPGAQPILPTLDPTRRFLQVSATILALPPGLNMHYRPFFQSRPGRYMLFLLAALVLYALLGFFGLPWLICRTLPDLARTHLHCLVQVDRVRLNPFLLTVEVTGFHLQAEDGAPLAAFSRLFVDLEMKSLIKWAVVLGQCTLERPEVQVEWAVDGTLNFDRLLGPDSPAPPADPDRTPFPLILEQVSIMDGTLILIDGRQSTPARTIFSKLHLQGRNWATLAGQAGDYQLDLQLADDATLKANGSLDLFPLASLGRVDLSGLPVAAIWQYGRDLTNLKQPLGRISLATDYRFQGGTGPMTAALSGLSFSLTGLACTLAEEQQPFLHWQNLQMEAELADLTAGEVRLRSLLVEEGGAEARISETGVVDLARIIRAPKPDPAADGQTQPEEAQPPFTLRAEAVELRNMALNFSDHSRATPLTAAIGGLDLRFSADILTNNQGLQLTIGDLAAQLRRINVGGAKVREPLFAAEQMTAAGGRIDLAARTLAFDRVSFDKGHLHAGLTADGRLDWLQMLEAGRPQASKAKAASGPGWSFLVKEATIEGFASRFTDLTTGSDKPVAAVKGLALTAKHLDGASPIPFTLAFAGERGGKAAIRGTIKPSEPALEAEINLAGLDLTSLQPYIGQATTLQLQSAVLGVQGLLRYSAAAPQADFTGELGLDGLRLFDPGQKKPYLSWDSVRMPKGTLTVKPTRLETQEIRIRKLTGELIIGEDHTLNLTRILKKRPEENEPRPRSAGAAPKGASSSAADGFAYQIGRLEIADGDLLFADLSLRPRFMTRIHQLKGQISNLSSKPATLAGVQLAGQVDQYGLARIGGAIRLDDFGQASNIDVVFRNVAMQSLSPYSGKFAGRLIKSGAVSADLKYRFAKGRMNGDNRIVIDNLVLGKQVETPDSANLPLDLAIALLKDANGRIDIGLPVSGELNDPEFSIGSLVWKMFTNLLTSTVTSPFRALGSLFEGDASPADSLVFDPGSSDLQPPEKEKLDRLAEALRSRPQLKLIVQGRYNPETDGRVLAARGVRSRVLTKLGRQPKAGQVPAPLDFSDSDTREVLEDLFAGRFGQEELAKLSEGIDSGKLTPRQPEEEEASSAGESGFFTRMSDSLGLYNLIPGGRSSEQAAILAGELYLRLVDEEPVADQSLQALAEGRAKAAIGHLSGTDALAGNRIGSKAPEAMDTGDPPEVSLALDAL